MLDVKRVKRILDIAVEAYDELDRLNRTEETKKLLQEIKALDVSELEELQKNPQLPELNDQIIAELIAIKNDVEQAESNISNKQNTLEFLQRIIQLATLDFSRIKKLASWLELLKKKTLYNGTALAIVYAIITGGAGHFGWDKTFFSLDKKYARKYAESYNLTNIKEFFPDFEKTVPDRKMQEFLLRGIVLEFNPTKLNVIFHTVEEGKPVFYVEGQVTLNSLTDKSKREIIKAFNLKRNDPRYRLLFS